MYILCARWAEIIPRAHGVTYSSDGAMREDGDMPSGGSISIIDLGDADDDAARWWAAVLDLDRDWDATISSDKGHILHPSWYMKLASIDRLTRLRSKKSHLPAGKYRAASSSAALRYLSSYCNYHNVLEQSHAALAATLLPPVAKFDKRNIQLPIPRVRYQVRLHKETMFSTLPWTGNSH